MLLFTSQDTRAFMKYPKSEYLQKKLVGGKTELTVDIFPVGNNDEERKFLTVGCTETRKNTKLIKTSFEECAGYFLH